MLPSRGSGTLHHTTSKYKSAFSQPITNASSVLGSRPRRDRVAVPLQQFAESDRNIPRRLDAARPIPGSVAHRCASPLHLLVQDMQICNACCPGERLSMWKYPLHCLSYSWNSLPQNEPKPEPDGDGYMNDKAYHHERCPTAEAYRLHDDDDDDDGEIYFIGKRAVKRSRRPQSHGSRSRRLKSAASSAHADPEHQ